MEPVRAEPLEMEVAGLELAGKAWGPSSGHPVLALHGWLDNAASFDRLAPRLTGARIVALDLPGHGLSDHLPPSASYGFIDWIGVVFSAADRLGWDRFILLGHSLGAGIAAVAAGTFPDRIERAALLEGFGPLTAPPEDAPARLAAHIRQRRQRTRAESQVMTSHREAATRIARATGMSQESALILARRGTTEVSEGVVWRWDPRLRAASALRLTEQHVAAFLGKVRCPMLVVRALGGYPYDEATLAARKRHVSDLTVVEVEGGHHVHLEDPERVAQLVGRFLAGSKLPSGV